MCRHRDQPAAQGAGLAKTWQLGEQLETDRLKNVRRVFLARAVSLRNRVNQVHVLGDQRRPGLVVAAQARADETGIAPRDTGTKRQSRAAWLARFTAAHRRASVARTIPRHSTAHDGRGWWGGSCPAPWSRRRVRW